VAVTIERMEPPTEHQPFHSDVDCSVRKHLGQWHQQIHHRQSAFGQKILSTHKTMTTRTFLSARIYVVVLGVLFSTFAMHVSTGFAQGTAFTYQGRLTDNGGDASGIYDLRFSIYDLGTGGALVSGPVVSGFTPVSNGLFTVILDFGPAVFDGNPRWLEIGVRTNGSVGSYFTLSPRQPLTTAPYAITAGNVTGPINGASIVNGSISGAKLANGSIGTNQLAPGAVAASLGTSGQSGVASGGVILSSNANALDLLNVGYVKIGQAELGELWQQRALAGDAASARFNHAQVWTGTEMLVWGGFDGVSLVAQADGARYNPALNTWRPINSNGAPGPRYNLSGVWDGTEMIVWGGYSGFTSATYLNDGAKYNPVLDAWTSINSNTAPTARNLHSAVWTGTEMIVWGGSGPPTGDKNDGGRYNPSSDTWTALPTNNAPSVRVTHSAVWTGTEMLIWGGQHFINSFNRPYYNDGARYNPVANTWTSIPTNSAPSPRHHHTGIWTGSEMIVWGGFGTGLYNDGGRYNPIANSWTPVNPSGAPIGREMHTAVWTGNQMIVWGGETASNDNSGGRYSPAGDSWTPVSTNAAPSPRDAHGAIWTGAEMIVWGGQPVLAGNSLGDGGRYNPVSNTWIPVPTTAPSPRYFHSAVWTGNEMIVWGGSDGVTYFNTGARYSPVSDNWTSTSVVNAPSGRQEFTAIWTGTEMIVWGGFSPTAIFEGTGGRYNPTLDKWTSVSTNNAPAPRDRHSAVWTGTEMIVWGGENAATTGGRYNPALNTWTNTSTSGAPSTRFHHTAVWTGTQMIVFGGRAGSTTTDSGGIYSPITDTWTALPTGAGPRQRHTAIWSGNEMIIWGGLRHDGGGDVYLNTGARFNPTNNAWTIISTNGAPAIGRWLHTGIWTGSSMIVWAGELSAGANPQYNDGGRYDPISDSWIPTTTFRAPVARSAHTAVWTGTSMLIFGGFTTANTGTRLYSYTPSSTVYLYQKP
jgi:N-acetylneuraminic acid mutarotase